MDMPLPLSAQEILLGPLGLGGLLFCAAAMTGLWIWQRRTRRTGSVDVVWAFCIGAQGLAAAALAGGWGTRRLLAGALIGLWAGRLALHLARRLRREGEDGRYRAMREALGEGHDRAMVPFFAAQASAAWVFALPLLVLASDPAAALRPLELAGWTLAFLALAGEALADAQLDAWKRDPSSRGRTCRRGLWSWSRHPNYFFEWLIWCGVGLACWGAPAGWVGPAAAALMLVLVLFVSGIPHTEAQALRSRGDDYRAYQREVSAFLPLPPKRS
jgi:steroid 5-alpha reductase family enzyme